jgi:hypothetical protein
MAESMQILLIRITSFPPELSALPSEQPWWYQLTVPIQTMYQVRGTGQVDRNAVELQIFAQLLAQRRQAWLRDVNFQYNPEDCECKAAIPPLSWHLSDAESRCIGRAWAERKMDDLVKEVEAFLQ